MQEPLLFGREVLMAVYVDGKWLAVGTSSGVLFPSTSSGTPIVLSSASSGPSPGGAVYPTYPFTLEAAQEAVVAASNGVLGTTGGSYSSSVVWEMDRVVPVAPSLGAVTSANQTTLISRASSEALGLVTSAGKPALGLVDLSAAVPVAFFQDVTVTNLGSNVLGDPGSRVVWSAVAGLAAAGATWYCLRARPTNERVPAAVAAGGVAAGVVYWAY